MKSLEHLYLGKRSKQTFSLGSLLSVEEEGYQSYHSSHPNHFFYNIAHFLADFMYFDVFLKEGFIKFEIFRAIPHLLPGLFSHVSLHILFRIVTAKS